jgi:penicillin-binding protein 2
MVIAACLFATLIARLVFLDLVDHSVASRSVVSANLVTIYTQAPRGEILDRSGQPLVANKQVPVVEVQRDVVTPAAESNLGVLLGMSRTSLRRAIDNLQFSPLTPVPVLADPTAGEVLYIQEHPGVFPGVEVQTVSEPYVTPLGMYAGDVIGYVGQVDASELASLQKAYPSEHYQGGDVVGQSGIEAELQPYLEGRPGVTVYQVDAAGKVIRVVRHSAPVPGDNVVLTLDGEAQKTADNAILAGQKVARAEPAGNGIGHYQSPGGSAVVEDPHNGQVLVLATEPTFDPQWFDQGITAAEYRALIDNPDDPLENRAIQGEYAPGSTFKVVSATAGLHYGVITPTSLFNDTKGYIVVDGHTFHDAGGIGAGIINVSQALTASSDNYFNIVGLKLWDEQARIGPIALQEVAYSYGLGKPTGIDLPGEAAGLIPTPAQQVALKKAEPNNPDALGYWVVGDSMEMAIGQFQDEVTPIQMANAYSTFANGGTRYRPQLVLAVRAPDGKLVKGYHPVVEGHATSLTTADRDAMIQGYLGVTHDPAGTAYPVYHGSDLAGLQVAGKTGTAQVASSPGQDTSVFVSFAPAYSARYVVDSFMEKSGYGESVAAPVVRRILQELFHRPLQAVGFQIATP